MISHKEAQEFCAFLWLIAFVINVIGCTANPYATASHQTDRLCRGRFDRWPADISNCQAMAKIAWSRTQESSRMRFVLPHYGVMAIREPGG